ncbi:MAG: MerR family transcriptional regulator [Eubacteriales bacterium]|nr:MerR family transcriptional regulator [Eubacteriales bacterium]
MKLTVGEVAKVLGISSENIRYYIREGLISPEKNDDNNYREYSSEDVLLISDIMFYRDMGISIHNIKRIFKGLPLEDIGSVIEESKEELRLRIQEENRRMRQLCIWEKDYNREIREINTYRIGEMPRHFRTRGYINADEHILQHLKDGLTIGKDDWMYVCMSFYINLNDENPELQKYISLEETGSTAEKNHGIEDIECIDNMCLITKVHISDDMHEMIDPLLEYARLHNFRLTGEIYGKEQTNYYIDYKRHWVCTLYAPIE